MKEEEPDAFHWAKVGPQYYSRYMEFKALSEKLAKDSERLLNADPGCNLVNRLIAAFSNSIAVEIPNSDQEEFKANLVSGLTVIAKHNIIFGLSKLLVIVAAADEFPVAFSLGGDVGEIKLEGHNGTDVNQIMDNFLAELPTGGPSSTMEIARLATDNAADALLDKLQEEGGYGLSRWPLEIGRMVLPLTELNGELRCKVHTRVTGVDIEYLYKPGEVLPYRSIWMDLIPG